jgi:hypothetical protein
LLVYVTLLVALLVIGPIAGTITGGYCRYDYWFVHVNYWYGYWLDYWCHCWSREPTITGNRLIIAGTKFQ